MELPASEVAEWMAYHLTCDEDWVKKYNYESEIERQKTMTNQQLADFLSRAMGCK